MDFFFRFKKNDELAVSNVSEKLVIPTPVEMNMKSGSVKVDSSWTVVNSTKYYQVAKLIAGNIDYTFLMKIKLTSKKSRKHLKVK